MDDTLLLRGGCLFIFKTRGKLLCLDVGDGRVRGSYPSVPVAELGAAGADATRTRISDDAFYQLSPAGVLRTYAIPQPTWSKASRSRSKGCPTRWTLGPGAPSSAPGWGRRSCPSCMYSRCPLASCGGTRRTPVAWPRWSAMTAADHALIFKPNDNDATPGVMVFDLTTGEKLHVVDALNHEYWVSPGGRLITYIGAGQLVAHDLATGEHLWSAKSDSNGVVAIGGQGDRMLSLPSCTAPRWGG